MDSQIALRELRNQTSRVLCRVEAGERITVTVGRPVANLIAHTDRRRFIPRAELVRFLESRQPDPTLREEVRQSFPDTTTSDGLLDTSILIGLEAGRLRRRTSPTAALSQR